MKKKRNTEARNRNLRSDCGTMKMTAEKLKKLYIRLKYWKEKMKNSWPWPEIKFVMSYVRFMRQCCDSTLVA